MIDVRRTILPDIQPIASDIRPEDAAEVHAAVGETPQKALLRGYIASDECYTVFEVATGKPLALFGCRTFEKGVAATVWLLAANGLVDHKWEFLRKSKPWVQHFHTKAPLLFNAVDQRNTVHIRWLEWLGFRLVRKIPEHGAMKMPFIEFARLCHG